MARRLAAALLALAALAALVGPLLEAGERGPERVVRAYLEAVEREDLDAAIQVIAPELREALRPRVELQLGSRYSVVVLALGAPSLAERALGADPNQAWASIVADVTPVSGQRWRSTSVARLVRRDGRWLLADPPFA